MTASLSVLVACDGRSLRGCPYTSAEWVETDSKMHARRLLAADTGWQYRRVMGSNGYKVILIGWADVCPRCVRRRGS